MKKQTKGQIPLKIVKADEKIEILQINYGRHCICGDLSLTGFIQKSQFFLRKLFRQDTYLRQLPLQ